jgi:(1->4)-alpha-D-glucan 1-alpha-D-glucosylmutase
VSTRADLPTSSEASVPEIDGSAEIQNLADDSGIRPLIEKDERRETSASTSVVPLATYRLQFGEHLDFNGAARVAPYLAELGISHLYASPWLEARGPGSHGYDITDYTAFNPVLGGEDGFEHLAATLATHDLGHIADFVPNHMGIGKTSNPWWNDVLEWGPASPHAAHFDIDWQSPNRHLRGKVDIPILGKAYGRALEDGDLKLRFEPAQGRFALWYHDHRFPIDPRSYPQIIGRAVDITRDGQINHTANFKSLSDIERGFALSDTLTPKEAQTLETALANLAAADSLIADCLQRAADSFAGQPGDRDSHRALHELLECQHYNLSYWRAGPDEINYRHFFNIADLAGIRIEDRGLFDDVHRLVARLLREGKLSGLRIDHIDGLHDPAEYCARLRDMASETPHGSAYLVVEKILANGETLPMDWPVAGTTGYDFVAKVNALLVDPNGKAPLTDFYQRFTDRRESYADAVRRARQFAVTTLFSGELDSLARSLHSIAERDWMTRDFTLPRLRDALHAVLGRFPVYRSYVTAQTASESDRAVIADAIAGAMQDRPDLTEDGIFDFISTVLTGDYLRTAERDSEVARFAMRFQQISGPISAKGIEDTTFYRYNRLIALNEVGGDPDVFGLDADAFHRFNQDHAAYWPHAMLATSTHDTKRGEDARARLAALSTIPTEWCDRVTRWSAQNRPFVSILPKGIAPSANDEYLLYQTLVGAWPIELFADVPADADLAAFRGRLKTFMRKALREAGEHSSWAYPNAAYEEAIERFIDHLVSDENAGFSEMADFAARVAELGVANSLVQLVLKCTCPGVPDIYQGTELWDLSLVDPDNRRPVDFDTRSALLPELRAIESLQGEARVGAVADLLDTWRDGRIKFYVLRQLLKLRQMYPDLFIHGTYEPLTVTGAEASRAIAFRRVYGDEAITVVVGLRLTDGMAWDETRICVVADRKLEDIFTGQILSPESDNAAIADILYHLPVAVLLDTGN